MTDAEIKNWLEYDGGSDLSDECLDVDDVQSEESVEDSSAEEDVPTIMLSDDSSIYYRLDQENYRQKRRCTRTDIPGPVHTPTQQVASTVHLRVPPPRMQFSWKYLQ